MFAADETPPTPVDEDSRSRGSKPTKEKRRRRSRSKQKEITETPYFEHEFPGPDDEENNSSSSTPKYERPEEPMFPSGGLICALCYCGEKSLLGQGDLTRYSSTTGFNPFKKPPLRTRGSRELLYGSSPGSNGSQDGFNVGEKITKTAAQRRGSKQMRETIKPVLKRQEYVDELSTVGCSEMLDVTHIFEPTGHVTAHHCCAAWSEGVTQNESYNLLCVDKAVHAGMSQRCHYCSRYGATIKCRAPKCERLFHYPCAAGSGCYQDIKSMSLLCTDHLELAPTIADPDELNCAVCDSPGQISDLLFCTSCGHHYHGDCLDPHVNVNPVVRAGWQCPECKICQTCRQPGDDNKMLVCDVCDKGYHTFCLRPAMTFIPKNGWCCKNCRSCTDCGSRTPGNGPSSRWHINYQVCDSCYQLRNKGSSCPICSRAYRNIPAARVEMTQCSGCKKWVHWECEEPSHLEECQKASENYKCLKCRNPAAVDTPADDTQPIASETAMEVAEVQDLSFTSLPSSEPGGSESMVETAEIKTDANKPQTSPVPVSRKRASTTSSMGSEKGNFALKGSSVDPMLCLGEGAGDCKLDMASPPRKFRHMSSDEALSARDRAEHQSSAESNLSSLFTDENAHDAMSLFGVDSLPPTAPRSVPMVTPSGMLSPDAKTFRIAEGFVLPSQPKVTLSPLPSPQSYGSPPMKPPGPGIGKPGAMFGKGKPFCHKKKPRGKGGKGKGKGHKRGTFSGARKRPKGGKGSNAYTIANPAERNFPRRARRGFQRQVSASPSMGGEEILLSSPVSKMEPVLQVAQADDEYGDSMHNTVVLCSTEDTFTLSQDMCVVCGSFGKGSEGRLIACSQCGQCYHPYCVNLKLTKVVLRKGWRCLDCTVCEECGQVDDPAHLLLCDDCDISYHTHCLKPPLQHVPKGGWKCKWCVRCVHCGTTSPGKNCEWASNYTACGPCASLNHCPRCRRSYKDEDVIMQCGTCERWIHAVCECLFTESDVEKVLEKGYDCVFCRPKDAIPPHLTLEPQPGDPNYAGQSGVYMGRTRSEVEAVKEYHKDCTSLTIAGLQHIQKQMQKHMGQYKKRPAPARGRGSRRPSDNQEKVEPPPVLPTLGLMKPKEALGQTINVAAAVTALQEPSEVYGKLNEDGTPKEPMEGMRTSPLQLPVSTAVVEALSSATATATEDSGMEGIERDMMPMRPEDLKSPVGDIEASIPKSEEFVVDTPVVPDPTKGVLGIQQGAIKRRRKPYRPGIGGFMIRQRGRGGLFKPRSRRAHSSHHKDNAESSKTDAITSETASDATTVHATLGQPIPSAGAPQEGTMSQQPVGLPDAQAQFTPPAVPVSNLTIVSPVKLKVSSSSSHTKRRKKKMKLIDQFPQYLQDAFFGREVLNEAENKSTPFDNLNERPASPGIGYGRKRDNDSHLVLPDRVTQRLEIQAIHQAATANAAQSNTRSQIQDEESMLMDRENEQELLGVLPDFPFKDDELLGMISSELKQEQGASDTHENILSPSSLEKMVSDGLDGLQNIGDVAALFSDVLNNQADGTQKQDNLPHQQGVMHDETQIEKQPHVPHTLQQETQASIHTGPQNSMHMQQQSSSHHEIEHQRQLAIQQELQQIEMKQREQQQLQQLQRQHEMQRQMSVNIPPTGYGMTSQDQGMSGRHIMNMGQGRVGTGQSVTPGPHGMPMVGQHVDHARPHSHHTTPVMSPVPMAGQQQGHAMMHHPSPHPTPPPPMFARQVSMPVLSHTGMQSPSATPDMLAGSQMHQQMQGQMQQGIMGLQNMQTKAPQRTQGHVSSQPATPMASAETHMFQAAPPATRPSPAYREQPPVIIKQDPAMTSTQIVPTTSIQLEKQSENQPQNLSQSAHRFQGTLEHSQPPQRASAPGPSYVAGTEAAVPPQQNLSATPAPTHKRSSSVPVMTSQASAPQGMVPGSSTQIVSPQQPPVQTPPVSAASMAISATQPSGSSANAPPSSQASENADGAPQLPNFPNQLFEPSPLPWPLGTDLENENPSVNQRNILKWEKDEPLGDLSTISPVLYANVKYPELKKEFPEWQARAKHIAKLWRKASTEERAPFLVRAKDNRALLKTSRARRGDASKTPTPPTVLDEAEAKYQMALNAQVLKQESQMQLVRLAQVQGLLQGFEEASKMDVGIPGQPVSSAHASGQQQLAGVSQSVGVSSAMPGVSIKPDEHSFAKPSSRTTTPRPQSPTSTPFQSMMIKQQPDMVPVSAYFAGQASQGDTRTLVQSPAKIVHAKAERRFSLDSPANSASPFPQSTTPTALRDSPSLTATAATVTRSLSLGAAFSDMPHATGSSLQTPPMDPKSRRLSIDSHLLQMQASSEKDIKPPIPLSPTPTQIRQVIYQQTTQRSSRRARLLEQSQTPSQPPPPYPSVSGSAAQAAQGFMYSQLGPRGQVMQIPGPGMGVLSPRGTQALIRAPSPGLHNPGMIAFRFDGQQGIPPGHPMGQAFPAGVHPVMKGFKGQQHPPGTYIELRHTNQSDAATRRQNIMRMANVCMAGSTPPQTQPGTVVSAPMPVEATPTTTQVKVELQTPTTSGSSEPKTDDPFAGGHMPHDEHLDALMRSDEFKDLHFQRPATAPTVLTTKGVSEASNMPAPTSAAPSTSKAHPVTQPASEITAKETETPADPKTQETTKEGKADTDKIEDKSSKTTTNEDKNLPVEDKVTEPPSEHEVLKKADETVLDTSQKTSETVDTQKEVPIVLKNDHDYIKSADGTSEKTGEPSESPASSVTKEPLKAKTSLGVDITSKEPGQDPRGVGLTPPIESQVAFVPTEEEKQGTSIDVSNVITVPGTPPCTVPPTKSPPKSQEEEKSIVAPPHKVSGESDKIEKHTSAEGMEKETSAATEALSIPEKMYISKKIEQKPETSSCLSSVSAYDLPPLPKSPAAPPMVQKLSKFAKVPDPAPPSTKLEDALIQSKEVDPLVSKPEEERPRGQEVASLSKDSNSKMDVDQPSVTTDVKMQEDGTKMDSHESVLKEDETKMRVDEKQAENLTTMQERGKETESSPKADSQQLADKIQKETKSGPTEKPNSEVEISAAMESSTTRSKAQAAPIENKLTDSSILSEKTSEASISGEKTSENITSVQMSVITGVAPTPGPSQATVSSTTPQKQISDIIPDKPDTVVVSQPVASVTQQHPMPVTLASAEQRAMATVQPLHIQRGENLMAQSVSIVTVTQTPLATVTAYRQPIMTTTPTLNTGNTVTVSAAHQVHPSVRQFSEPGTQSQLAPPTNVPASLGLPAAPSTPSQSAGPSTQIGVPVSGAQTHMSPNKDETKITPPRSLLIKEQPLLLQELLEEEKREQEKARREKMRHTQTLLQQQTGVQPAVMPPGPYVMPGPELETVTPESGIDTIKMEFLSRMNQAAKAGLTGVPPAGGEVAPGAPGATPLHQQPQTWPAHMTGAGLQQAGTSGFSNEAELRKYRNWLIQQQQLMQIQVPKQEQLVQSKKTRKQSLMKKRNQYKRNGKEFSAEDTEELRVVTKQYTEAQQQLEKLRNDQKQHAELIQDFNNRQRHMLGSMSAGGQTSMVQPPQGQMTSVIDRQQQQQVMIQHSGTSPMPQPPPQQQAQQIAVPPYQTSGIQQATPNMPQQQIVMMQQGPQQLIIKSVPASTNIAGTLSTTASSVTMGIQQQQPQVVMATQQPAIAQFQNMTRISPTSPNQIQQLMISQQLQQQQQQQQLQLLQQQKLQQQSLKETQQQRAPPFMPPQSAPPVQQTITVTPGSGNQTHNAFMQMQMQQLMALQIEQQQQLAAFKQNADKPKPKRRRRKKKSQIEKEEEERQLALAAQQQQQQQLQGQMHGVPQHLGPTWQQRHNVPPTTMPQTMQPHMMTHHQHTRFSHPGMSGQMQLGIHGVTPSPGPPTQLHMTNSTTPHIVHSVAQSSIGPASTSVLQPQSAIASQPYNLATTTHVITPNSATKPQQVPQAGPRATTTPNWAPTTSVPFSAVMTPQLPYQPSSLAPPQYRTQLPAGVVTATATMVTPAQSQTPISAVASQGQAPPAPRVTPPKMGFPAQGNAMSQVSVIATPTQQSPIHSKGQTPPKSTPLVSGGPPHSVPASHHVQATSGLTTPSSVFPTLPSSERSTPNSRSPRHGGSFEGLSEAEIAILMAHDPDLNQGGAATPVTVPPTPTTPYPLSMTHAEHDDKTPADESKNIIKRVKKGYVMDEKAIHSIDSSIDNVVRLSAEYEDKVQAAKGQEVTPSPWELDPKPTKFPPKKTPEVLGMGLHEGMFGQAPAAFAPPARMIQGITPEMMAYSQMQQGMGIMPFTIKPSGMEETGQKKKRSRRGSKDVGPDGKPIKRRRRKTKDVSQQQQQLQIGPMVDGNMQEMVMQAIRPTMQGGIISSGPMTVGQISPGQAGVAEVGKASAQWKPLPLLRLIEPEIRKTHHMCVPKGTGLTECRNVLKGLLGEATYLDIPDLYGVLLKLDEPKKTPGPPTPPSSQPSSPTRKQNQARQTSALVPKTETVTSEAETKPVTSIESHSEKYGPLGLIPTDSNQQSGPKPHATLVTVPESFATPPHQGIEDKEDLTPSRPAEDVLVPPSSPEMEEEDDWSMRSLAFLRNDDLPLILKTSPEFKMERIRDTPSPTLPFMLCPKIRTPPFRPPLSDKDAVSVTIEFDNANIKSIEKSLTLLSRILDTSIISYTMMKTIKPDKKLKDALSQSVKEEQPTPLAIQTSQASQAVKGQPEDTTTIQRQRRCVNCNSVVSGNGVRKPQFNYLTQEEDVIYCNKDCFIKSELLEKKVTTTPTKKKFKASHVYQRQTQKISMASLLEQYPDEDPITPTKNTRSSAEGSILVTGVQDSMKGMAGRGRGRRRGPGDEPKPSAKRWRGVRWKKWSAIVAVVKSTTKPPVDVEALLGKYGSALKPSPDSIDKRVCVFCSARGDGDTHTIARLLNVDVDRWVHLNCALWSAEVYETQGGALINVDLALRRSESVLCCLCQKTGATIHCHRPRCVNTYHCQCALDIKCVFFKDKTVLCPTHAPKTGTPGGITGFSMHHHHSGDALRSLAVFRKVYVQRPETKQIASIMQQGELAQGEKNYVLRVGAMIFENVGQLATHQMAACHSRTAIYPIGYRATRMYWSPTNMRRRCRYECSIREANGKPMYAMKYKAALPGKNKPDKIQTHADTVTAFEKSDVNDVWLDILTPITKLRSNHSVLKLFPAYINGEKLFGLTAPVVSRILESLPNIELCGEYKFRYGRTPLLELPLAINPTGCARSEPHIKQHRKKPHTLISNLISEYYESSGIGDASSLYGKQFVHSKSSQYRRMKSEWRSNVYLARSRIQGLGLFAARDIEPGTMVIEYIGDIIRTEVSEKREKMYEAANRGVYMFRLDSDHIVDATVTGGPARYINHSCKPNCVAEVVNFEKEKKIMIVSNRHLLKGEELSYDYKFDFEDEGRKIPCLCGASNCKKWMN